MIDLLLSINMTMTAFVNQLLTMGLPVIDESLAELMSVMKSAPTNGLFGEMQSMARGLGITLALCVGSYECWVMILGRRWKSHTNLTHPGKYFRPSKVKIMRPTSPK